MDDVQATSPDPVRDSVAIQSSAQDLRARNHSVLPLRQARDLTIGRPAFTSTVYGRLK
jgi:hypothetical protein